MVKEDHPLLHANMTAWLQQKEGIQETAVVDTVVSETNGELKWVESIQINLIFLLPEPQKVETSI